MKLHYKIKKNVLYDEHIGKYATYGIYLKGGNVCYKDISPNKKVAQSMVDELNKNQVSVLHLPEVIDMIMQKLQWL